MKREILAAMIVGSISIMGCTSTGSKSSKERQPQSSTSGTGSIGSGEVGHLYRNVLGAVSVDFDGNGSFDRAVLVQTEDSQADLYIYLDTSSDDSRMIKAPNVAFSYTSDGSVATMIANSKGSLLISSGTDIGRFKNHLTLTVVMRRGQLLIGGITYAAADGLNPNVGGGSCDMNLLTGKGTLNGRQVKFKDPALPLENWRYEDKENLMPAPCRFENYDNL